MDEIHISQDTIEEVRFIMHSKAWLDFYEPTLRSMRESWIRMLLNPTTARKNANPDDYIRGCVDTIDALLGSGPGLVQDADEARCRDEEVQRIEADSAERAGLGTTGPLVS